MTDRVLLIDGFNAIWRANIAFKPKDGQDNSFVIVYNFFRSLRATVEEFSPRKVFFCLEGKNNFRYKLFPEYKANRIVKTASDSKREDFLRQKDIIIDLIRFLPITIVKSDGYEADDVVATLVEDLKDEETIVISNDSDYVQLLQKGYDKLKIYNPFKKEYMSAPDYHYLTWKCIKGDKSDNIPGILGPKKAEKLANDIESFGIFLSSEENRSNYSLNKELIELKIIDSQSLDIQDYSIDFEKIRAAFATMDFKTMIEDKYWNRFCDTFSDLR